MQLDNVLAFIGSFAGTLLIALAFPRSRQHLLEQFQPEVNREAENASEHAKRTAK